MNLLGLKEFSFKKKFDKILSKEDQNKIVSQKEIQSIGILTTTKSSSSVDLKAKVEAVLGVKNIQIISFKKLDKPAAETIQFFTKKDITWRGGFIKPNLQKFLEQPFDLLIGYFDESNLYLEMAVLQSKATFKVGFSEVNENIYKLEVLEKVENIQSFLVELKKYLKILQKLKN